MKFGPRFYLLFVYFESSLINKRDSTQQFHICEIKDLNLPKNGDKWSCNKVIPGHSELVPKNAKCNLECEEGYDVRSRKFIEIILGFLYNLSNKII